MQVEGPHGGYVFFRELMCTVHGICRTSGKVYLLVRMRMMAASQTKWTINVSNQKMNERVKD